MKKNRKTSKTPRSNKYTFEVADLKVIPASVGQCLEKDLIKARKINDLLINVITAAIPPIEVVCRIGRCAEGGEQTGNQLHFWQVKEQLNTALAAYNKQYKLRKHAKT